MQFIEREGMTANGQIGRRKELSLLYISAIVAATMISDRLA
jgi:hypothetical protein